MPNNTEKKTSVSGTEMPTTQLKKDLLITLSAMTGADARQMRMWLDQEYPEEKYPQLTNEDRELLINEAILHKKTTKL